MLQAIIQIAAGLIKRFMGIDNGKIKLFSKASKKLSKILSNHDILLGIPITQLYTDVSNSITNEEEKNSDITIRLQF